MVRNMFAASAAILLALLFFVLATLPAAAQDPKCGLLADCTFDDFNGNGEPCSAAWKCDNPGGVGLIEGEGWPKGPSLAFVGDQPFERKIFQRVAVTPGKGYRFSAPFAVVNINGGGWHEGDQVNRRLGIDPYGGTDPNSSNIKWSNDFFGKGRFQDDELQVSEYARADHITVFIWVINPYGDRHVDVFVDTPGLFENPDMPPIEVTQSTVTPPPPPPTSAPPTAKSTTPPTDEPEPTVEPTQEPPAPTEQPTEVVTDTPQDSPTQAPVLEPTQTRVSLAQSAVRPTRVRSAAAAASSDSASASADSSALTLGVIGVVGLVGISSAIMIVGIAVVLLLRRK